MRKPREIVKGRESWSAAVCGVAMSWTRLLDGITATTRYRNAPPLIPSSVRPPPADPLGELVKQSIVAASSFFLVHTAICNVTAISSVKGCHLLLPLWNLNMAFCLASVSGTPASERGGESQEACIQGCPFLHATGPKLPPRHEKPQGETPALPAPGWSSQASE